MFGLIADRMDSRELVFKFLCKARQIYAGSCVSVRGFTSGEMLMISRLNIRSPPVVRTIFCVILRDAIKIPIYNAFRCLIIVKSSLYFVKVRNVEILFQRKTKRNPRGGSKTHSDSMADVAISKSCNFRLLYVQGQVQSK